MRTDELFYIVGVGRSGTTLLMSMLNAHPEIGTPPETHFLSNHLLTRPQMSIEACRERLASDHRFARLGLDLDEVLEPLVGAGPLVSMRAVYLNVLSVWKEKNGVRLIGDKAPRYVEILPVLSRVAPGAKVLHLIRDPRSVFLSRTKAAWSADRGAWRHLLAYAVQYAEGRSQGPRLFGARYKEVLYEQLISDPEAILAEICAFLDVAYSPAMLQFSESAAAIISEDEWAWKREAAGPLLRENADKWRDEMSPAKVATVERACAAPFRDRFYTRSGSAPGMGGRLTAAAVRVLARLYRTWLRLRLRQRLRRVK